MPEPIIGAHLDLKGCVWKPEYLPQFLSDLAAFKINTLLVEYEDVFPFHGVDIAYDPATVWSAETLARFRAEATSRGIQIIPLQQCVGHLQYVFRWPKYAPLAVDTVQPCTLDLQKPEGKALVREMLRQVMAAHPESRYVHLGMDEAHGLARTAERMGVSVIKLLSDYLEELVDLVAAAGKTPIIWSDMLEDHFDQRIVERLRDRVVLCLWDYITAGDTTPLGRFEGWRMSREWLDDPRRTDAPAIHGGSRFFEDLAPAAQELLRPYRRERGVKSFFGVDLFTKLGFRVLGASHVRRSSHGAAIPPFLTVQDNIVSWAKAVRESGQLGLIGTSWARGTTFCPPNFPAELTWPNLAVLSRAMGAQPPPCFDGVPPETLEKILGRLSRCCSDWSLEKPLAGEIAELTPQVRAMSYEWRCLELMVRAHGLQRRVSGALSEVDYFLASESLVPQEWQRRIDDQARLRDELAALRAVVAGHFGQRYHGRNFEEWLRFLFDVPSQRLDHATSVSRECLAASERFYSARPAGGDASATRSRPGA